MGKCIKCNEERDDCHVFRQYLGKMATIHNGEKVLLCEKHWEEALEYHRALNVSNDDFSQTIEWLKGKENIFGDANTCALCGEKFERENNAYTYLSENNQMHGRALYCHHKCWTNAKYDEICKELGYGERDSPERLSKTKSDNERIVRTLRERMKGIEVQKVRPSDNKEDPYKKHREDVENSVELEKWRLSEEKCVLCERNGCSLRDGDDGYHPTCYNFVLYFESLMGVDMNRALKRIKKLFSEID